MNADPDDLAAAIDAFVDQYRTRCLWFLRPDYYPRTLEDRVRVLEAIARHGDRAAFVRAAELRRWLSQNSSEQSPGC